MLFRDQTLAAIALGEVTLAFRRWKRPTVKAGGRVRTASGVVLIGGIAIPGAFLAKAFVERMPVHIHTWILDAAVITGGLVMISSALRAL